MKVAKISFAYNNEKLIKMLRQRGTAIKEQEWEQVDKIESKINELKNSQFEKLTRPRSAFVTFETEDAYERACKFNKTLKGVKQGDAGYELKCFLPYQTI